MWDRGRLVMLEAWRGQGCSREAHEVGRTIMGNTELQTPSKRVRILLFMLIATVATAIAPASAFAADWTW